MSISIPGGMSISKTDFQCMMRNLPVPVEEEDIDQMFDFADKDKDGKISYSEFQTMINPQVVKIAPKYSFRNLQKYLPQLKEMARKEGIAKETKNKEEGDKKPIKVNTVLSVFKDEKVPINV